MSIKLLAVKFNHDPNSHHQDALNIRRNASEEIQVPEWVRGMTQPEDSLAAYALKEITGNIITIQAKFERLDPLINQVYIKATNPPPQPLPQSFWKWLLQIIEKYPWIKYYLYWLWFIGFGKNAMGEVKETLVTFDPSGESDYAPFELHYHFLQQRGIGRHLIEWHWQYRLQPNAPWTSFDISKHLIFTVLQAPTEPWNQQPYPDLHNPWVEVLDRACQWAAFQNNPTSTAGAVTQYVNEKLGLTYDTAQGASVYTDANNHFLLSDFLNYLKNGTGKGNVVNCMDCATIVTTFANALGCDLMASRMGWYFALTDIKAIGSSVWDRPFGNGFRYHEVAWTGTGGANDPIFDACLRVDGDDNPWSSPYSELLPKNMPFTTLANPTLPLAIPFTANSYRERLCTNTEGGILQCKPDGPWPGTYNGRRRVT
jgi:hypothetical protein